MELINSTILGFQTALAINNLFYCFVGTMLGTLIGVLPGIGPAATIALLLPITFKLTPVEATIMIAGIYYGAMFGGSTTSILVNIPGEAASVTTCLDGYEMAKKGRAGAALGMAAFGSFIGGTASTMGIMLLAEPLSAAAVKFGPPEFFCIMCLGLTLVVYLAQKDFWKSLIMAALGLALSTIGLDITTTDIRFGFGIAELNDGVGLVPMLMGLFGISEVMANLGKGGTGQVITSKTTLRGLLPTLQDWIDSRMAIVRGTLIGFGLGILPGGGGVISSFVCYALEKKFSKRPEQFGTGVIEGVAAPETANNAATGGAFIPLFILGIPSNVVMALLLTCLMVHGLMPGPTLVKMHPDLFWGTIASMYIGNAMCLIFNLPMIGVWVQLLKIPYKMLFPLIVLFCAIGAYSMNNNVFDIFVMIIFGVLGFFFRKVGYETPPLVLAFILGRIIETALRQSLILSNGSFMIFLTRPISAVALSLILASFVFAAIPRFMRARERAVQEADDQG